MNRKRLSVKVKEKARSLGFALVGITTPEAPAHLDVYADWIAAGHHGEMGYLASERAIKERSDPRSLLPECKSVLVLGIAYANPSTAARPSSEDKLYGRVAAYAWGDDYHDALKARLKDLVAYIEELKESPVANRWYTDTGPILESELAQRAGLGWIGKNSLLINPQKGSYFLLSEILLDIELEVDRPITNDYCGSCTRCIEACPTDCILPNRTVDATRCISYLTIELKEVMPHKERAMLDDWVFGCDICQEVCPWNMRFAPELGHPDFAPREGLQRVDLEEELQLSVEAFSRKFKRNPVKRPKRRGYLRNVAVALGNAGEASSVTTLGKSLLGEEEALIRGHVAWALGKIGGRDARKVLEEAEAMEKDTWVQEEIKFALNALR